MKLLLVLFSFFSLLPFISPSSEAGDGPAYEQARVQKRLELIETLLRREAASSPELEKNRQRNLDHLREYWQRGEFPKNDAHPGLRVPYFIDYEGTPCAVGYLLLRSGKNSLVKKVRKRANNIYIDQIQDPEFLAWAENSGLTLTELELIQPTYEFMEREREKERKKKEEEDEVRRKKYDEEGPDVTILDQVHKKIQERASDITGIDPAGDISVHRVENKKNSPSTVTIGTHLRARSNEKYAIEWGDKKESMVPDCWEESGCAIDNTFSHTYFVPGTYQVKMRKTSFDCKVSPNSRCETGDTTVTRGPAISVDVK